MSYLPRNPRKPPELRLVSRITVDPETLCWNWTGGILRNGHGIIGQGTPGGSTLAHRYSWMWFNQRDIPDGMWVLHHCDNRRCVNPDHLYIGDVKDNSRDAVVRGRHRWQQPTPLKLTPEQVAEIRATYRFNSREFGSVALGRKYGVSPVMICKIVKNEAWTAGKHVCRSRCRERHASPEWRDLSIEALGKAE